MYVIEFFGYAGSGKSTITKNLLRDKKFELGEVYKFTSLIALIIYPLYLAKVIVFLLLAGRNRAFSKDALNWIFVSGALLWAKRKAKSSGRFVLFDQLTMQALRSLSKKFGSNTVEIFKRWHNYIEVPDVIFLVAAPRELVEERLYLRGGVVKRIDSSHYFRSMLGARRQIILANNYKGILTGTLDARVSPEENADFVGKLISENYS